MATALADDVYQLHCRGVNAYLLDDGDPTLIDTGSPWDAGRIQAELRDAGYGLDDIERVLLTHYDIDHVGGLGRLSAVLDASAYAADPDRAYLAGLRTPPLTTRKELFQRITAPLLSPPSVPVRPIASGDKFGTIEAIRAPGHTPGHTVFVSERLSTVVFGDALRSRRGRLVPMYNALTQFPDRANQTVQDLADRLPDFETACVGHGTPLPASGDSALAALAERID